MLQLLKNQKKTKEETHPLLLYDPDALKYIQLLKMEYFEDPILRPPVPRRQGIPKTAVGILHSKSILVATSHAWFYQCHPDPYGNKLNLLRKHFIPKLRKSYPNTEILIFDEYVFFSRLVQPLNKSTHTHHKYNYEKQLAFLSSMAENR